MSIVGRLSTLQSVHYQRFHCILVPLLYSRCIVVKAAWFEGGLINSGAQGACESELVSVI